MAKGALWIPAMHSCRDARRAGRGHRLATAHGGNRASGGGQRDRGGIVHGDGAAGEGSADGEMGGLPSNVILAAGARVHNAAATVARPPTIIAIEMRAAAPA